VRVAEAEQSDAHSEYSTYQKANQRGYTPDEQAVTGGTAYSLIWCSQVANIQYLTGEATSESA
jgi:hypothetical protein